jgi:hypothetical protein
MLELLGRGLDILLVVFLVARNLLVRLLHTLSWCSRLLLRGNTSRSTRLYKPFAEHMSAQKNSHLLAIDSQLHEQVLAVLANVTEAQLHCIAGDVFAGRRVVVGGDFGPFDLCGWLVCWKRE